jgi:hypothetical protein
MTHVIAVELEPFWPGRRDAEFDEWCRRAA